ncbi:CRISPR-associated endonuclease Cas4g/Cas1g [Planctomicrobium sp. SH664]|uniref:CRISPR-associated endonuclease Cas4g/Cas1g n=1 Tax=Planctomicrobium sp. SH664 TaxID=3448125 RepID=UPI003F5CAF23
MISGPDPRADVLPRVAPALDQLSADSLPNVDSSMPTNYLHETEMSSDGIVAFTVSDPPMPDSCALNQDALIPVRMLNEFTYCPRLGYLEFVQGEWSENLETLQGTFGHRNVDKPDRKSIPAGKSRGRRQQPDGDAEPIVEPESDKIHARSVMLSAEREGLLAKLDLLEIDGNRVTPVDYKRRTRPRHGGGAWTDGNRVTPVDYKRGQVPDVPEGAYEPERVQLCAQGLILRENGFECTAGVIYYIASRRRVTIPFDDALIARTRDLARQFRAIAASGQRPPPLVDSPKCPRCSLVGICLPDETNLLLQLDNSLSGISGEPSEEVTRSAPEGLRKLLPARHQALPLYVQNQGAIVGKSGERITIKVKGEEIASVRLLDISQVCVFGNVMFTAQALQALTSRSAAICHFSYGGWFHSMTTGLVHKNIELRIRQFAVAANAQESLNVARQLIAGKIKNCRTLLRRHLNDEQRHPVLKQLAEYARRALIAGSAETLLGLEGMAAKEYFAGLFQLFPAHPDFDVNGRNRRPPRDPVNAVLSFVYSLLTKELTVVLQAVGFDPMLGVFHRPRYGRPSLALDLAEEFRPLIADSVTLTAFNNGEVGPDSFIQRAGAVAMTDAGRRSVIAAFERRLETEIVHPLFGYKVCYRRILEVQARLLARHLLGELPTYPHFITR